MSTDALEIRVTDRSFDAVDADILLVPVFERDDLSDLTSLDRASSNDLSRAQKAEELRGKPYDLYFGTVHDSAWPTRRFALIGAGAANSCTTDRMRKLAVAAALAARQRRACRVAFVLRSPQTTPQNAQAIAEGMQLAAFDGDVYKSSARDVGRLCAVEIVVSQADGALMEAVSRGVILGHCSNLARELANEPGNTLTPRVFADRGRQIVAPSGVSVEVLDEHEIERLGMGLLLGVSRGSCEPPRLVVMKHEPPGVTSGPILGLIGKGVTFDTGGISIKPADGMDRMKSDMSGGAAVMAAMRAIGLLHAPIRVIGVVPATENMPGGRAIKPGDVLRGASGKTVEVNNTDAEGRLILGDALWYARELGATHLVDVATLTGACVVALGKVVSGLFGEPEWWLDVVRQVGEDTGDRLWPLPIYDEYLEQLRSEIADVVNTGGRAGGAITAAMFLKEFTGGLPWAHLDIAGTAWVEDAKPYAPKGATGVAVRALANLAFTSDRWQA